MNSWQTIQHHTDKVMDLYALLAPDSIGGDPDSAAKLQKLHRDIAQYHVREALYPEPDDEIRGKSFAIQCTELSMFYMKTLGQNKGGADAALDGKNLVQSHTERDLGRLKFAVDSYIRMERKRGALPGPSTPLSR